MLISFVGSFVQMHNNVSQHADAYPFGCGVCVDVPALATQKPQRDSNGTPKDPKGPPKEPERISTNAQKRSEANYQSMQLEGHQNIKFAISKMYAKGGGQQILKFPPRRPRKHHSWLHSAFGVEICCISVCWISGECNRQAYNHPKRSHNLVLYYLSGLRIKITYVSLQAHLRTHTASRIMPKHRIKKHSKTPPTDKQTFPTAHAWTHMVGTTSWDNCLGNHGTLNHSSTATN